VLDWFRFNAQISHGFRQVGNSVPPLLGKAIGSQIVKVLGLGDLLQIPPEILQLTQDELLQLTPTQASNYYGVRTDQIPYREKSA
jgi:DNA (cytosine-5)-methyltransferase 1